MNEHVRKGSAARRAVPEAFAALAAALLLSAGISISCVPDPGLWFPAGKAEIVRSGEREEADAKSLTATIRISNAGQATIRSSTISASLDTDARTYYRTITEATTILPGGSIYTEMTFVYDDVGEKAGAEVKMENCFFE
jgi:hypothetical protein